ncbi:MAG: pentapeptide repeat-containing protein [Limibaculum sp.]
MARFRSTLFMVIVAVALWVGVSAPPSLSQTGAAPLAQQALTEQTQAEELAKLRQEVIALQRQNELQESGGAVLYWLSGLSGLIGGMFGLFLAWFGVYLRRAYSEGERRKSETERRKLDQERELEREKHNLELLKGLGSENARLQLASASVLLQRIADITDKSSDSEKLTEGSYLIEALVAVTKEAVPDDRLNKFIGDGILRALNAKNPARDAPEKTSPLKSVDLQKSSLKDVFWRDANLREVDFFRANLTKASLREADLTNAVLFHTVLHETVLRDARLAGANLAEADLVGADLRGADLTGANLSGANLSGADLTGARLDGANLADIVTDQSTRLPGAADDA